MNKCKVKDEFVIKDPDHGRDHDDMILTKNSADIFWYPAQNRKIVLMMEFYHGHPKYDKKNYYAYKAIIGTITVEEFNEYFEIVEESDNEKLHLSDADITKIKNLFEELIRENVRHVDWMEYSNYGIFEAISDGLDEAENKLKDF